MSFVHHYLLPPDSPPWLAFLVDQFAQTWQAGRPTPLEHILPIEPERRKQGLFPLVCIELQYRFQTDPLVRLEEFLERFPELEQDPNGMAGLIKIDYDLRKGQDPTVNLDDYLRRFPMLANQIRTQLDEYATKDKEDPNATRPPKQLQQPNSTRDLLVPSTLPGHVGRYRVEKILGTGGFGLVYLAHDDQLLRLVAIKVPHANRIHGPDDVEEYLAEARTVTSLEHPNIVTVLDVGSTAIHPFFVVSKYIDGSTLQHRIQSDRPSLLESIGLVITIAKTLHFAHKNGIIHRDIKPGNILLDKAGLPYVADFGLALREQDLAKRMEIAGTPAYMSPEQARGEGHRIDGRSDLFSLGVVFYELLTGRLPFKGESISELLDHVIHGDFHPPRQWDENIPKEIERICNKSLSKRASDRFSTCNDFAKDLAEFLKEASTEQKSILETTRPSSPLPLGSNSKSTPGPLPSNQTLSDSQPIPRILPKGLRSFDAHDADFFLELLPGPRDRYGLPDSIRFWKLRIEETDADQTFSVGLIYGPSGCGKSSLVKAGLLPRLDKSIVVVYFEATDEETETRLLKGLRKQCPELPAELSLVEALNALRRRRYFPRGHKILIVIDQFEQWLHAHKEETNSDLMQALRHCDGKQIQCILMVRDDFTLAVYRFLRELEIRQVEGQNFAVVDLFDTEHAKKVLMALGRAFGRLPDNPNDNSREQTSFITQAVASMAQDGKVIPVRLALFAEMMKKKPWTIATLKAVGGTAGVRVTFLEESFSAATASPDHRYHQQAARAVLQTLLPESGADIKGHMRSYEELLDASGYGKRPSDFADLLRLLDNDLRLITPTNPEGNADMVSGVNRSSDSSFNRLMTTRYYQLTHDYLVPSLRDWLTLKQKESRRGRAELLLADRAAIWAMRPESRQLPSLLQWLQIRGLTSQKNWSEPQRKMMQRAKAYYIQRIIVVSLILGLFGWLALLGWRYTEGQHLADLALDAKIVEMPAIVNKLKHYYPWIENRLRQNLSSDDISKKLHSSLALLPLDKTQIPYLKQRLLLGQPDQVDTIRTLLIQYPWDEAGNPVADQLWKLLENPASDWRKRFRAACSLAVMTPDDPRWNQAAPSVAELLASQDPYDLIRWAELLKPIRKELLSPLANLIADTKKNSASLDLLAKIFDDYAREIPESHDLLESQLSLQFDRDYLIKHNYEPYKSIANRAAVLLAIHRKDKVLPLLIHQPDPTLRSYCIEAIGRSKLASHFLMQQLQYSHLDVSLRRALLLSLNPAAGLHLLPKDQQIVVDLYRDDPDGGIHGAARWILQQWGLSNDVQKIDLESREKQKHSPVNQNWFVNKQGQTMMAIPNSTPGLMMSADNVTIEQFQRFYREVRKMEYPYDLEKAPNGDCPAIQVNWYDAAEYCNWLSREEGIPKDHWCYEPNKDGKFTEGMAIKPGYFKLHGYRLPTESEWEKACRAGADNQVDFSFGQPTGLLPSYGWYIFNSGGKTHSAGQLKPNDFGLFDMHGNVLKWTQTEMNEAEDFNPAHESDRGETIKNNSYRVVRGGGWVFGPIVCRSNNRRKDRPGDRFNNIGFRLARVGVH